MKYREDEDVTLEELEKPKLYNDRENRRLLSRLYKIRNNELLIVCDFSRRLKKVNIRLQNEAMNALFTMKCILRF